MSYQRVESCGCDGMNINAVCDKQGVIFVEKCPDAPSCPSTRPSPSFYCTGGVWTAVASVEENTLSVDGGVQVVGNLTILGTLTFNGPTSSINVSGCVNIGDGVEIILSVDDLDDLDGGKRILLYQNGSNCPTSASDIPLAVSLSKKSCKKVKVAIDSDQSSSKTLGVIFKIDSSKCKVWWIVVASVIGGLVLIVVVLALIFGLNPRARALVRPHSKRANEPSS
jgi:hypothetical protein